MEYSNVRKGGKCWNGAHRDSGVIIHIVEGKEVNGFWGTKSLCGTEPKRRGYGWTLANKDANCEKCIKKFTNKEK